MFTFSNRFMAKITEYEGKYPPHIEDCVVYPLDGDLIIRVKSGFTTKGLLHSSKYVLCRQNASEFGLVSKTCKAIRLLVANGLSKHNNLQVVNAFTKKMRSLLVYDTVHERGKRNLGTAFTTKEAQESLKGYTFNPDSCLQVVIEAGVLALGLPDSVVLQGHYYLGFRVYRLSFDFELLQGSVKVSEWYFEKIRKTDVRYGIPNTDEPHWITLVEVQFFAHMEGEWMPVLLEEKTLVVV